MSQETFNFGPSQVPLDLGGSNSGVTNIDLQHSEELDLFHLLNGETAPELDLKGLKDQPNNNVSECDITSASTASFTNVPSQTNLGLTNSSFVTSGDSFDSVVSNFSYDDNLTSFPSVTDPNFITSVTNSLTCVTDSSDVTVADSLTSLPSSNSPYVTSVTDNLPSVTNVPSDTTSDVTSVASVTSVLDLPGVNDGSEMSSSVDRGSSENFVKDGEVSSLNHSEDTNSISEESLQEPHTSEGSDQPTTSTLQSPPQKSEDSVCSDDGVYTKYLQEHNNGSLKGSSKKRKISSGPGRGRPKKQSQPSVVPMYHSQISGDKNTIKIRIRKSNMTTEAQPLPPTKKKSGRRKKHKGQNDPESEYHKKPKRNKGTSQVASENDVSSTQDIEQSPWGNPQKLSKALLSRIFDEACASEGCLPVLVRLCKVCRLWRDVATSPSLWKRADLNYVKEKNRTDLRLHWLILNRLTDCQDLNMGEWKVRDIQAVLEALSEHCPKLTGLNLNGWKGINSDHLKYLTTECKKLERLDLSSVNATSAINSQPLVSLSQTMNTRLTHLVLAHNKIAGFMPVIAAIASHCPNLQLLDISNIRTFAHTNALLHVEKLQTGCPKLRVLRITNSQIWLAPASLPEQMASPGFPMLEELSLAGLEEDQTTTSRSVDDEGIERLLKSSKKLRLLDVRGCSKLTDSGLVRVPAWDLEHLFLSACYITRLQDSGLELIVQKWSHSLLEVDLAWSTATVPLDAAVFALAEKGDESKLRILNLCGSSVSLEPVKAVLSKCQDLNSINLQSCRALPRGIKRLYTGTQVKELRDSLLKEKNSGSSPDSEAIITSPQESQ